MRVIIFGPIVGRLSMEPFSVTLQGPLVPISRYHCPPWGLYSSQSFLLFFAINCLSLLVSAINREWIIEHKHFFFKLFGHIPGHPGKNPRISRKVWFPWVSRDIPSFSAPIPSCGRPPPHRKISGPKSLGLCTFFLPELIAAPPTKNTRIHFMNH